MENGWIKVHRKMTEWEWYKDPNTSRLFFHLLLTANHKPQKWRGIDVPAGATITSIRKLAAETNISERGVRTAIKHLISTHEVTQSTTSRYTLIQLTNYEKYQLTDTVDDTPVTQYRHSSDTPVTTNKNDKNERMKEDYIKSNQNILVIGAHKNVRLTADELQGFLSRFPETGQVAIDKLSGMLHKDPRKKVTNTLRYLEKIAADPGPKKTTSPRKTGPFSGQLPDWYSDTGSQFANEQERQQMLDKVREVQAKHQETMEKMKGKK